jgi:flotillin
MVERSKFGQQFTKEVEEQLKSWGVIPVKAIELMDIRDVPNGKVIHNIMEKRKSHIEMDSRITVATNLKAAQIAEVSALQDVDMQKQLSEETVKVRETAKNKIIGVAKEQAQQEIIVQSAITKNKEMEVIKVQNERSAEIEKQVSIINAEKAKQTSIIMADGNKQTAIINAESNKQSSIIVAEGSLASKELEAKAITVTGLAQADAERAIQLVPVTTQITLANEIGTNVGYQQYLVNIRQIEANEIVGIEQAKALSNADVKVISNTGTPTEGITKVMDLFSTNGGQKMGAMLESFVNTDVGKQVMSKVLDVTQPKTKK